MKYLELYNSDSRYKEYVDKCAKDNGSTVERVLQLLTVRLVGDYYIANPAKEEKPMVQKMKSGGC